MSFQKQDWHAFCNGRCCLLEQSDGFGVLIASIPFPSPEDGAREAECLSARLNTGIEGLDHIRGGGLPRGRIDLVEGAPGTGKTTLALQFLLEGVRRKERVLYFALSESRPELEAVAGSHGWSLDETYLREIMPVAANGEPEEPYTLFHPSEVELGETITTICRDVERLKPERVVIDSLAEMRLLAQEPLLYRRQILGLKHFFMGRQCTVLMLDDRGPTGTEHHFQSLVHGVISLEQLTPVYGPKRRQLEGVKLRGVQYADGRHDVVIRKGGIIVYPRLVAADHQRPFAPAVFASGLAELDALVGGGLERGTSALLMGPSGVGTSTLAARFALAAAERGEHAVIDTFDEAVENFLTRMTGLGIAIPPYLEAGRITIYPINPAQLSPGEFTQRVRVCVEKGHSTALVIDSLNGTINAMPAEESLLVQLHELLTYLDQRGVVSLLVLAQHGLVGSDMEAPVDVSYLADTVLLLRYFEVAGEVRKAISVVKKRTGRHELTIRELRLGPPQGIRLGPPLREFQGVLTGTPMYLGKAGPLLAEDAQRDKT